MMNEALAKVQDIGKAEIDELGGSRSKTRLLNACPQLKDPGAEFDRLRSRFGG
jgi:hypothetical protein